MHNNVGILVHGDNHFIVRGPCPDRRTALALVRQWSSIQIGGTQSSGTSAPRLEQWRISTREFRENLEWAVIVPGDSETSPAVQVLLNELCARGVAIRQDERGPI